MPEETHSFMYQQGYKYYVYHPVGGTSYFVSSGEAWSYANSFEGGVVQDMW